MKSSTKRPGIYFTITNDIPYDQRMNRICTTLANHGYQIVLVGRKTSSAPLEDRPYQQVRIRCIWKKGPLMYAEFNLRLFFFLLMRKMDAICAIDLDTILPVLLVSKLKNVKRIYDAHEYFTGLKEVYNRPLIYKFWHLLEKVSLPSFRYGYTVSDSIARTLEKKYSIPFSVIRNVPVLKNAEENEMHGNYIFYGGAVNEGRGLEYLIPAMKGIDRQLLIAGDGNFMQQVKQLIVENNLGDKIRLLGMIPPAMLDSYSRRAILGIGLIENAGPNQFMALPNKFFDYIHCELPQLTMAYPEIIKLTEKYRVAFLIEKLSIENVHEAIRSAIENPELLDLMRSNCRLAREELNWQKEETILLEFYENVFKH